MDLIPQMELRIENAYYRNGREGFLGTEVTRYQVRPRRGLRLLSVEPGLTKRLKDQRPVQDLIRPSQRNYRRYRYFYAVVFKKNGDAQGSVLLGAGSAGELDRLTAQLRTDPDSICGAKSPHCAAFPKSSTVALELQIVVNGAPRTVLWGSVLASIAAQPRHVELWRPQGEGQPAPVEINLTDPDALRLRLQPGDQIKWD